MISLIDNSALTCDEIYNAVTASCNNMLDILSINLNDKKATSEMDNSCILVVFLSNHIVVGNNYYLLLFHKIA